MAQLFLPRSIREVSDGMAQLFARRREKRRYAHSLRSRGRRTGTPHGSYIDDRVALGKSIVLCWRCRPRFDARAHEYRSPGWGGVEGQCDACKEHGVHEIFLHESSHGQVWS